MNRLDPLQRHLATNAVSTADRIAAKYAKVFPQYADDIESAAYWGAVRAAAEYDKSKSLTHLWATWSKFVINCEVKEFLRSPWAKKCKQLGCADMDNMPALATANPTDTMDEYEHALSRLTEKQRRIIQTVNECNGSIQGAADTLGMTCAYAETCYWRAVQKLKREYAA